MKWIGYVLYGIYVASTLWLFLQALAQLHLLWLAKKNRPAHPKTLLQPLPLITVQVPVYNEKFVIEGLLTALSQLDYPRELLEIQVLDDSTDETAYLIDQKVAALSAQGYSINVLRRADRQGYKAGALQHALPLCTGEFVVIFDADFRPPPNFIHALLPHFSNPSVGMVQARWGHLNEEQNFLTRIQTYLLNMHFVIEQAGRYKAGYFSNFCGTAGIWRKQCIIDAGGWDGAMLSEDLDLSYRAQRKGWRFVFDDAVVVPAELPTAMQGFKTQQFRWTKGIAQVAKRNLKPICQQRMPWRKKIHGIMQLMGSFVFVFLFINALLTVPLLQLRSQYPQMVLLTNYTTLGVVNLLALGYLYFNSFSGNRRFALYYPIYTVVYLALSVQNAIAVMQGWVGIPTPFVRTPKTASASNGGNYLNKKLDWITAVEFACLFYFLYGIGLSVYLNDYFFFLFFVLMIAGLSILLYPVLPPLRLRVKQTVQPSMQ